MKAEMGKVYLTGIPHQGTEIAFQHPESKGRYMEVAGQIDKEGLQLPNSNEIASLLYDAFQNPKAKYESEIIGSLKSSLLWEFTGNLYLPKSNSEINNGVILENNPDIIEGKIVMDKSSLVKRLRKNDPNVTFVPFGYKIGRQSPLVLSKNPYIVARYGEEGAEKIAEVASKYESGPKLRSFESVDNEMIKMSYLNSDHDLGLGLCVGGDYFDAGFWDDSVRGHSFGLADKCASYVMFAGKKSRAVLFENF